jgi:hypothetical protein
MTIEPTRQSNSVNLARWSQYGILHQRVVNELGRRNLVKEWVGE